MGTEQESKKLSSGNTAILRVAQGLATALVFAIRWPSVRDALETAMSPEVSNISGGIGLFKELMICLLAFGLALGLTSISLIYLHTRLMSNSWGGVLSSKVRRSGLLLEALAMIFATAICWLAWPRLARSAYFGYQELLESLVGYWESVFLCVILGMLIWGVIYSIFLFRRDRHRHAEHS
jgi:hypothetical protein